MAKKPTDKLDELIEVLREMVDVQKDIREQMVSLQTTIWMSSGPAPKPADKVHGPFVIGPNRATTTVPD